MSSLGPKTNYWGGCCFCLKPSLRSQSSFSYYWVRFRLVSRSTDSWPSCPLLHHAELYWLWKHYPEAYWLKQRRDRLSSRLCRASGSAFAPTLRSSGLSLRSIPTWMRRPSARSHERSTSGSWSEENSLNVAARCMRSSLRCAVVPGCFQSLADLFLPEGLISATARAFQALWSHFCFTPGWT